MKKESTFLDKDKKLQEIQTRIDFAVSELAEDNALLETAEGDGKQNLENQIEELNSVLFNLQKQREERENQLLALELAKNEIKDKAKTALLTYLFPPLRFLKWGKKAVFISVGCLVGLCCCFLFLILAIVLFNEIQSGTDTIDNALFVADNCTGDKSLPECFKCVSLESMAARGGEELDFPTCE